MSPTLAAPSFNDRSAALAASCRMPTAQQREAYRASGHWQEKTFLDGFLEQVATRPRQAALVCYHKGIDRPETVTYGQLGAMVERMAVSLIQMGLERDDVVSIQLPNGWRFAVAALAAARAGAVVNPLVSIFRRRELEFMLNRAQSKFLIVPDSFRGFNHAALALELQGVVPSLRHVIVGREVPGPDLPGTVDLDKTCLDHALDRVPDRDALLAARRRSADDVASLIYTSGTTGEPKGTLHTYATLRSASRGVFDGLDLAQDDVGFMASPMGHLTGFLWGFMRPMSLGMTMVYQDNWEPHRLLDITAEERIAWTVSATPFVVDMIREQERAPRNVDSFRIFVCGGAPIPPTLSRQAHEVLGIKLLGLWGTSECGSVTLHRVDDSIESVASSDGHVHPFMELKLVDESGQLVAPGAEGRLLVKGPGVFVGYLGRRDLYDAVVDTDGWFDTGDLGIQRADGAIRISGRSKDIIVRGGENVPVVEVENLLLQHPKVAAVVVVGVPDFRLGEKGCAVVVPRNGEAPTMDDITAFLSEHGMARQYWPEHLVVRDSLPLTPSGKVQKYVLRDELKSLGGVA